MDPDDAATDTATQTPSPITSPYEERNPRLEVGDLVRVVLANQVPDATGRLAELLRVETFLPLVRFFEPARNEETGEDTLPLAGATGDRPVWYVSEWRRPEPATWTRNRLGTTDVQLVPGMPVVARLAGEWEAASVSARREPGRLLVTRSLVRDGGQSVTSEVEEMYPVVRPTTWPPPGREAPGVTSTDEATEIADLLVRLTEAKDQRRRSGEWCGQADRHAREIFVHKAGETMADLRFRIVGEVTAAARLAGELREARAMLREVGLIMPGGEVILSSSAAGVSTSSPRRYSVGDRITVVDRGLPGAPSSGGMGGVVREVIDPDPDHDPDYDLDARYWVQLDGPTPTTLAAATRDYGSPERPVWYAYAEDLLPGLAHQGPPEDATPGTWEGLRAFTDDFRPRPGDRVRVDSSGIAGCRASRNRDATVIGRSSNLLTIVEFDEPTPRCDGTPTRPGDGGSEDRPRWRAGHHTIRLVERPSEVPDRQPGLNDRVRVRPGGLLSVPDAASMVASVVRVHDFDGQPLLLQFDEPVMGPGGMSSVDGELGHSRWWASFDEVELYSGSPAPALEAEESTPECGGVCRLHLGGEAVCGAWSDASYGCTRPPRHEGEHVACGGSVHNLARWSEGPPTAAADSAPRWSDLEPYSEASVVGEPRIGDRVLVSPQGIHRVPTSPGKLGTVQQVGRYGGWVAEFDGQLPDASGQVTSASYEESPDGRSRWGVGMASIRLVQRVAAGDRVRVRAGGLSSVRSASGREARVVSTNASEARRLEDFRLRLEFDTPTLSDDRVATLPGGTRARPRWSATLDQVELVQAAVTSTVGDRLDVRPTVDETPEPAPLEWPTRPWARVRASGTHALPQRTTWVLMPAEDGHRAAWVNRHGTRYVHELNLNLIEVLYEGDEEPAPPRPDLPTRVGAIVTADDLYSSTRRVAYVLQGDTPATHAYTWQLVGRSTGTEWVTPEDLAGRVREVLFEGLPDAGAW